MSSEEDAFWAEQEAHYNRIAKQLGITDDDAMLIDYLRMRSRWSEDLENRCIAAMKAGHSLPILAGEEQEELKRLGF